MNSHVPRRQAFSLIELIIVISVIAIIATFTIPTLNTVLKGSHLNQGANMILSQLNLARQQALSRNRQIEVRFYRYADPEVPGEVVTDPTSGQYRAMQLFEIQSAGLIALPIDRMQRLPGGVVFSRSTTIGLSSLLDQPTAGQAKRPQVDDKTAPKLPRGIDYNYEYVSMRFLQDGSTNKSPIGKWFITLVNAQDKLTVGAPPPNFFTVQIDPVTGATKAYRPNAG